MSLCLHAVTDVKLSQGHILEIFLAEPQEIFLHMPQNTSPVLSAIVIPSWLEVSQPPEHPRFIMSNPLNIFLLFWTKSVMKMKTHLWLWRRYSRCQNGAGNRESGHSVWCHGSIFSFVAFAGTVARDVSKRNSCFTYQHHFLSYLKPHHVQHFVARCLLGRELVSKHAFIFN